MAPRILLLTFPLIAVLAATGAGPAAAAPPSCGSTLVSDTTTTWTGVDEAGNLGILAPSVRQAYVNWATIPAANGATPFPVWIVPAVGAGVPPAVAPITFTAPTFSGCGSLPYYGDLYITGDDGFVAYLNGVPAASCGIPNMVMPLVGLGCWDNYQLVRVPILSTNLLVIQAWNANYPSLGSSNPAMIQFRIDY